MQQRQAGQWRRLIARLEVRAIWRWQGLLLWLVRRPWLRFYPLPVPSCQDMAQYQMMLVSSDQLRLSPQRVGRRTALRASIFKELLWLRSRMGDKLAWEGHSQVWAAIQMARASKTVMARAARAEVESRVGTAQSLQITDLLGPRGGVPKRQAKLSLLAEALGLESKGTVAELQQRCRAALGRIITNNLGE